MHNLWQKLNILAFNKITRKKAVVAVICIVLVGVFIYTMPAYAWDFGEWFTSEVLLRIAAFLGKILLVIIEILIAIVQYNDFVNNPAVQTGWSVVRDVCNMFFILVLLVIAFGTVFKIETYRYNRLLGRLIMMAVLINFSKMIAGFFIDISQVVLLTFVNGFKDTAAGNFTSAFGLREMLGFSTGQENAPKGTEALGIGLMAIVMTIVAMVVMIVMVVVFLIRIIMLWILVVLSPLAYLLYAFPGQAQQYSHRWWSSFGKYVATGPVLAFFIWLGLAVITGFGQAPGRNMSKDILKVTTNEDIVKGVVNSTGTGAEDLQATASKAGSSTGILNFIISIAMFVGALMIAQQMGGVAGNFAGAAMGRLQKAGSGVLKSPLTAAKKIGGSGLSWASQSKGVKGMLGTMAASRIPGLSGLATRAYVGLDQRSREQEDKSRRYMKHLPPEVIARIANQKPFTAGKVADSRVARDFMPSSIEDNTKLQQHLASMSRENLQNISDPEWTAIGKRMQAGGMDLTGNASNYVRRDMDARGAFNFGLREEERQRTGKWNTDNWVKGTDRYGKELEKDHAGLYGFMPYNPNVIKGAGMPGDVEESQRLLREKEWKHKYDLATEKEMRENKTGPGITGVGEFGRGLRDTVLFDFNRLSAGLKEQILKGSGQTDVKAIKGINITDKGMMKSLAGEMTKLLNEEKAQGVKGKRLENLERARQRFSNPVELEKINAVSLVNSSSVGYERAERISRRGEVVIHEEAHTFGVSEAQAPELAQKVRKAKVASQRKQIFEDVAVGATIDDAIQHAVERKASGKPTTNKPDDIIKKEKGEKETAAPTLKPEAPPPEGAPAKEEKLPPEEEALIDKSLDKYEATKTKVGEYKQRYGGDGSEFFVSGAYNPDEHFSQDEFEQAQKLEQERGEAKEAGGVASFGSGKSNVIGINANTFAGEKYKGKAGLYVSDPTMAKEVMEEYEKSIEKEMADLRQRNPEVDDMLGQIDEWKRELKKPETAQNLSQRNVIKRQLSEVGKTATGRDALRLNNLMEAKARIRTEEPENITIVNKDAVGYNARHIIAHEDSHNKFNKIDEDGSWRKQMFEQAYSEEEQEQVLDQVRQKMGYLPKKEAIKLRKETMSDEAAIRELFAEGMANAMESRADKSPDAIKLKPDLVDKVKKAGADHVNEEDELKPIKFMTSETPPEVQAVDKAPSVLATKAQAKYSQMTQKAKDIASRIEDKAKKATAPVTKVVRGIEEKIALAGRERELKKQKRQFENYDNEAGKAKKDATGFMNKFKQAESVSKNAQLDYQKTLSEGNKEMSKIRKEINQLEQERKKAMGEGNTKVAGEKARQIGEKVGQQRDIRRNIDLKKVAVGNAQSDEAGARRMASMAVNIADDLKNKAEDKKFDYRMASYGGAEKRIKQLEEILSKPGTTGAYNEQNKEELAYIKAKLTERAKAKEQLEIKPILPKDIPKVQAEMVAQSKAAAIEIDEVPAEVKGKPEVKKFVSESEKIVEDIGDIPPEREVSQEELDETTRRIADQLDNLSNALQGTSEKLSKEIIKPIQENFASIKQTEIFGDKIDRQNFLYIFKRTLQDLGKALSEREKGKAPEATGGIGKIKKIVEKEESKT